MLNRDWAKHKHKQHRQEITFISRALKSQENALQQLKMENEELYEKALQVRTYSSMMKRLAYLG
jgi:large subunit ribosomal protein L40